MESHRLGDKPDFREIGTAAAIGASRDAQADCVVLKPGFFENGFENFALHSPAEVDYKNASRAPLLMVAGEKDHTIPPATVQAKSRPGAGATRIRKSSSPST